jgi:hypothetical protein
VIRLRRLLALLSPWRLSINPRPDYVEYVAESDTENFLSVRCVKQKHSWIVNVGNLIWSFECYWRFLFCCSWMRLCLCGTEASNGLIVHPLDARWMNTEQRWNMYLTCENLCQCHVVDHKHKRTVPGLNSGLCGEKSAHNHLSMAGVTFIAVVLI